MNNYRVQFLTNESFVALTHPRLFRIMPMSCYNFCGTVRCAFVLFLVQHDRHASKLGRKEEGEGSGVGWGRGERLGGLELWF